MENNNEWLEQGYEVPASNNNFLKLKNGENKFRILSKPIIGYLDWKDKKPLRFRMKDKPATSVDPAKKVRHFWAFTVWNYSEGKIQILEITQSTIQTAIQSLAKDGDWGNPFGYDIKITKTGENMETKYAINPVPHKPVSDEIKRLFKETPVNLDALYEGKGPFEITPESLEKVDPLPF